VQGTLVTTIGVPEVEEGTITVQLPNAEHASKKKGREKTKRKKKKKTRSQAGQESWFIRFRLQRLVVVWTCVQMLVDPNSKSLKNKSNRTGTYKDSECQDTISTMHLSSFRLQEACCAIHSQTYDC
jgi:hypothetical protein